MYRNDVIWTQMRNISQNKIMKRIYSKIMSHYEVSAVYDILNGTAGIVF